MTPAEKRKAYLKAWKLRNPDYERNWKKANPDKVKANALRWYHNSYKNENARWLLIRAKRRAQKYGLPFNLKVEDITVPEFCPALGIRLVINKGGGNTRNSPSLDRIKPELGYVKGNVIVVSLLANAIKTDATPEQILAVGNFYADLERKESACVPTQGAEPNPDCHPVCEDDHAQGVSAGRCAVEA